MQIKTFHSLINKSIDINTGISTFLGYLIPKPSLWKNYSGTL